MYYIGYGKLCSIYYIGYGKLCTIHYIGYGKLCSICCDYDKNFFSCC